MSNKANKIMGSHLDNFQHGVDAMFASQPKHIKADDRDLTPGTDVMTLKRVKLPVYGKDK